MLIQTDFDRLPSLEEFKKQLDDLKNIRLDNPTFEEIKERYFSILPFMPRMTSQIHFHENRLLPFYRVRLNIGDNEDLNLIRTYSYPTTNFCFTNGRANVANKTVFYCSNEPIAAVLESKPKVGDIGYLSVWKNDIVRPLTAAIYLPKKFNNPNKWQSIANEAHLAAEAYFLKHGKDKVEHFNLMNRFMSDRFVTENPPYILTSFVSNEALYGTNAKDLIIYPSVASKSHFCNFAIHPNVVDRYLTFQKVIRFKIKSIKSDSSFSYGTGRVGEIINNNIVWRDGTLGEVDFNELK